jgi:hypothetical protein
MGRFDTTFTPPSSIGFSPTTTFAPTTTSSGSSVGNFFRSDVGKQTLSQGVGAVFNFLGTAFASNQARQDLKGQANIVAQQGQSALSVEQERTRQAQLALEAARLQGSGAGGNMALYIGLGVVGVVVLGVVIFAVTRRSNA